MKLLNKLPRSVSRVSSLWETKAYLATYKALQLYGLKHILLLLVFVAYTCIGAAMFVLLEEHRPLSLSDKIIVHNVERRRAERVDSILKRLVNNTKYFYVADADKTIKLVDDLQQEAKNYERDLILIYEKIYGPHFDPVIRGDSWKFETAFIYVLTIITTVGHSTLAPQTQGGRIATMLYGMLGIPLFVLCITDCGRLMAHFLKQLRLLIRYCWRRLTMSCRKLSFMEVEAADLRDRHKYFRVQVPLAIGLILVLSWLLLFPLLLSLHLSAPKYLTAPNYITALYTFFLSFCTISLAPELEDDIGGTAFTLFGIFVGLSLVCLCIQISRKRKRGHQMSGVWAEQIRRASDMKAQASMVVFGRSSVVLSSTDEDADATGDDAASPLVQPNHHPHPHLRQRHLDTKATQTHLSFTIAKQLMVDQSGKVCAIPLWVMDGRSKDDVRRLFREYVEDEEDRESAVLGGSWESEERLLKYLDLNGSLQGAGGVQGGMSVASTPGQIRKQPLTTDI